MSSKIDDLLIMYDKNYKILRDFKKISNLSFDTINLLKMEVNDEKNSKCCCDYVININCL